MAAAVKKIAKTVTFWSYSALALYDQCPFKFKCAKLDKLPDPMGPAGLRGDDIHKKAQGYTERKIKALPAELKKLAKEFAMLLKKKGIAEEEWAWSDGWKQIVSWFDRSAWSRVKIDHRYMIGPKVAVIIDYKTGKLRDGYEEQLWLYALAAFKRLPAVEEVRVQLWYTDHGIIVGWEGTTQESRQLSHGGIYTRKQHETKFEKYFAKRIKPMFSDRKFLPRTNQFCKTCTFRQSNGGPCKYG